MKERRASSSPKLRELETKKLNELERNTTNLEMIIAARKNMALFVR